jgi:predicted MPP superfamily phosphohydrolase
VEESPLRRPLLTALVIGLALCFLASVHAYIATRLLIDPGVGSPWRELGLAGIALLGLTLVLQPILERSLRPPAARIVAWPASLWMGFAFLILLQLLVSDALLWLGGSSAFAAAGPEAQADAVGARAAIVAAVALVAGAVALRGGLRPPSLVQVEIPLQRWPHELDGFRIAQISDIHIGPLLGRDFAAHLVERVNGLDADLVAVTGDLVDGGVRQLRDEVAPFEGLTARRGVFFVTGNHDHYSGAGDWAACASELGMQGLRNERVEIQQGGSVFDVVGVDDHRGDMLGREGGEDLDAALAGRDPARPALLLAHDPSTFKRASQLGIDLQISGHTHGGQIWPFRWFVRLATPFVAGRYARGDAQLYVSRGTGFWGPPMRLFAPAEITEITLRAA